MTVSWQFQNQKKLPQILIENGGFFLNLANFVSQPLKVISGWGLFRILQP